MSSFHPVLRFLVFKDAISMRQAAFLMRRPHRSFRLTRRRDYVRSLKLPGYWAFTATVWRMIWRHKRIFILLALIYTVASLVLGGVTSQQTYQQILDTFNQSIGKSFSDTFGSVGQAGLLFLSAFVTPGQMTGTQQIILLFAGAFVWLTTVWLLREMLAGRTPRLRDGIYSAGSPVIASLLVLFVGILQLIPLALVALVYAALTSVSLLVDGLPIFLFTMFELTVGTLVLYWMTPTFLALVIVTLPGMYPVKALRAAGDIVVGRRLRILYRILWMLLMVVLAWVIVMVPVILLSSAASAAIDAIKNVPIVPYVVAFMGAITLVWISAYIYMLYRRIIDDDASPA